MERINLNDIGRKPQNGFVGKRVDGSSIVIVDIGDNKELKNLMIDNKDLSSWDKFCDLIGDFDPRGQVDIDWLFVNGKPRVFH
jgi:hypothetical protein|tara:strand:- start:10068 stop:10316 length:249 start_codon:yes stop_codon:yes gene_type:complete